MARNRLPRPGTPSQAAPGIFSTLVASRPAREGRAGFASSATSVALHAGLVALLVWATMDVGEATEAEDITIIDLATPVEPVPPAPAPPVVDAPPEVGRPDVPQGSLRVPTVTVIPPDIPAPVIGSTFDPTQYSGTQEGDPEGTADSTVSADDIGAGPIFTPMTTRPTIRNRDEVARELRRSYPGILRDAGIGGTVVVWILIDETGQVLRTQVQRSSGHEALDAAALHVGDVIEFTPAMNRDRAVKVWVQWPIAFEATR